MKTLSGETMPGRRAQCAMAICLLASLSACSDMMGGNSANQAPRMAATTQPTVAPEMVRQVQSRLRDGGYYKQGAVDGVWGAGTEASVRSFQHDHNLASNGQLDVPTLQALNLLGGSATTTYSGPVNNTATQPMNANPAPAPMDNAVAPAPR